MIVASQQLWQHLSEGLPKFPLRVGPDGERLADGCTKPLNGIGRPGTEQPRVGPQPEKPGQGDVVFLKSQPASCMPEVGVLDLVLGMPGQLDGRGPLILNAELDQHGAAARLQDSPQLRQKANGTEVEDELRGQ